ncbi:type I polyketide synthase [Oscillatoria sp. FACHB-1406]|uniref:type I polyketide synthase n=1 Tax=Oscillatoria sp. FACHB-1406 TaxID=2692846 RepID=UPI001683EC55|nr:type I polyketide synthase [Oscillatoria sp. FACHB-1406]MBD2580663.1 alpha/beta fold hydrolase [Oscillatoria sp. FACHB-1406]
MTGQFSNFVDLLRYRASKQSEKIVFTFLPDGETEAESLTYRQLDERARAIAVRLNSLNATGERALLLYPPGLEFIAAFFGCLYAGVIAVPAYPPRANRSLERLQAIVSDAGAEFALATSGLMESVEGRLTHSARTLSCVATDSLDLAQASDWQPHHPSADSLAFLQYTSGSTGNPKGVMVSHANLMHNSGLINRCFQDTPESKGVSWLPPYHDMGLIGGILQPVFVGASMTLMPPVAFLQRPLRWLQAISRERVTTSGAPNFAYDLCVNQITPEQRDTLDLSCWQLAFSGAEPVRAETLERFADYFRPCGFRIEAFHPCYGMAETTLIVSGGAKQDAPILQNFESKALEENRVVPVGNGAQGSTLLVGCGKAIEGQLITVNPDTFQVCSDGEIGEIWVKNESVARGYWGRETLTQEMFNAHLATGEGPFLRTGDLGFLQAGELFVTGRIKDLIIIRGRNYYPQDIEATVEASHDAIREACGAAFAVEVEGEERLVITYEVKRSSIRSLNGEEVGQAVRKAIAQHHELQVDAIAFLKTGSVPKTSSGKIQRHACKAGYLAGTLDVVGEWKKAVISQPPSVGTFHKMSVQQLPADGGQATRRQPKINPETAKIQAWLIENIAARLGFSPLEIDSRESFAVYGLDSVQAVRLTADLEDFLGRKLSPTLAYDYPTIEELSQYLSGENSEEGLLNISVRAETAFNEPIAIIGIGCRFPQASNPEAFWRLLREGKDAISPASARWEGEDWGGFLTEIDRFDAHFFGISPREVREMDPQQRLLLEVSWEALENAGIPTERLGGSATGVFVGISSSDYSQLRLKTQQEPDAYSGTGNAHSIAANRLSYYLDLRGPSLSVDTACSSSLVAVHLAVNSLQAGECDRAIAAGVNLILSPELTQTFTQAGMMAADGRCKTFDAKADGYVRGEGCGAAILKRLSDAERDGDTILAVVRGSAINQDGRSNGLTAPNGNAQQAVIRQALQRSGKVAGEIDYLEAHGTGTALGDPIEVNSLKSVLMQERTAEQTLYIGSAKTNIGHLEAAAGIAGLIKTILSLQAEEIPPHLHFTTLNPHIDLTGSTIAIPTQIVDWKKGDKLRAAGVSSFGFGGTNAHVIVEEYRGNQSSVISHSLSEAAKGAKTVSLLTLSAKNEAALTDLANAYHNYITARPEVNLQNLCFTANTGRTQFSHRLAILAPSCEQLEAELEAILEGKDTTAAFKNTVAPSAKPKITFLFTGQGSQYAGMGEQLYQNEPIFRAAIDRCAEILQPYLEKPLLDILYPKTETDASEISQTYYTQPALFSVEYALAQLWQSWGIEPSAVMGHSVGEYVAACLAGVFSLEDGLKLISHRAKLMQALPGNGGMAAVMADEGTVAAAIVGEENEVAIAAINGTQSVTISGEKEALDRAIARLQESGIKTTKLQVSHAFHSPLMEPMLTDFERIAREIEYFPPTLEVAANLTGTFVSQEIATPEYWVQHIRQPVRFADSIQILRDRGYEIFLEIGPKPTLIGMGKNILNDSSLSWLPSLHPKREDGWQMRASLAALWVRGANIDWQQFEGKSDRQRLTNLPNYPFQRQSYWLPEATGDRIAAPTLKIHEKAHRDWFYREEWVLAPEEKQSTAAEIERQSLLIFAPNADHDKTLLQSLQKIGDSCWVVYPGERYKKDSSSWEINPSNPNDFQQLLSDVAEDSISDCTIIYLWGVTEKPALSLKEIESEQKLSGEGLLHLLQALYQQNLKGKIWVATRGTQIVFPEGERNNIAQSILWGMANVIALEYPELWGGIIDLPSEVAGNEGEVLAAALLESQGETRLAFRNGKRYVSRLQRAEQPENSSVSLQGDASYLITGGLGSLGLEVSRWLVEKGAKYLVILGRSEVKPEVQSAIARLQKSGATVISLQADVSNEADLKRVLDEVKTHLPPLRGIVHAAGILDDGLLAGLTWERFEKVFAPKVRGAWNLHQLTQEIPLDFFVLFSSVASVLGSPGQGNYAAANAFLDAIAHYRRSQQLPALSINFGPLLTGMATQKRLSTKGLEPISIEAALSALDSVFSTSQPQIGIWQANWEILHQQFPNFARAPYFQNFQTSAPLKSQPAAIYAELLALSPTQRETYLTAYLQTSLAQILQLNGTEISKSESLLDLGMDSLMVMEAVDRLKTDLDLMLYPREFYERPKIEILAKYLAVEFAKTHDIGTVIPTNPPEITTISTAVPPKPSQLQLDRKLPKIAFILSSPRAGSTLLRVMLAGHPDLASPPELHLLPFDTMGERESELGLSHLGEGLQRALMELQGMDGDAAEDLVAKLTAENRSIPEVYAQLQTLAGERLLVDKSPTYAFHRETLERAEAMFSGAKYVHLARHPYAVIESFCRLRMDKLVGTGQENPFQLAESIWTKSNQNIIEFFEGIEAERHYLLHYEALVKNPEVEMQKLCDFLEIPYNEALLEPYQGKRMTDGVKERSMSVGDPNFLKRDRIDAKLADTWQTIELPQPLSETTQQVARSLDYDLPREQTQPIPLQEEFIDARGLNLCVCRWGEPENPLILCVHGILEQGAAWRDIAEPLARQGYCVVAPDLRGHGRSDRVGPGGSYNLLDFLADIDRVVEQQGERPFTLVGHSLGSVLTAMYASIRPEKVQNLILIETVLPTEVRETEAVEQLATHLNYLATPPQHPVFPDVAAAAARLRLATPALSESFALQLAERITEPVAGGVRWRWDALLRTRAGIGYNGIDRNRYLCLLKQIQAPITLVYGDRSDFNRPEDLAEQQQAMAKAAKIVLPGGHNLHLEAAAAIAEIIRKIARG